MVDYDVRPGVAVDMGDGDQWPQLRERLLAADVLAFVTPTWVGHMSSVAQRALERINAESGETDEQYEGCLSFFDYRGLVVRPLRVDVEHARFDGTRMITSFERAMARLVSHEIDHLEGRLYVDRMAVDALLVPVEEYGQTGRPWTY